MFVPFDTISHNSKIWIYQSAEQFTAGQKATITNILTEFTDQWKAHGHTLKASFSIVYDHFIILTADESFNATSGCSVDESVRTIKAIEQACAINLFDRNKVPFLKDETVYFLELSSLKENFKSNIWNESSLTFNNLIQSKQDLENSWIVPAGSTWLKRYVLKDPVNT